MKLLFNPKGDVRPEDQRVLGGNPTNIYDIDSVKFKWAEPLYMKMRNNFWIPEEISMNDDKLSYAKLTDAERNCFDSSFSFIVFLDSLQELHLPRITEFITARELNHCFSQHIMQEGLHIDAYKYIVKSVVPLERQDELFNKWKNCPELRARCEAIALTFNELSLDNLRDVLLNTYFLEGLFFWMSFKYFYLLCSQHKMVQTATQIAYLNRDELTHCVFFQNLIKSIKAEGSLDFSDEAVHPLVAKIVEAELEWDNYLFGDTTLGFSPESIEIYVKHLANERLKQIGNKPLYLDAKYKINPFKHLERNSFDNEGSEKTNFFESRVIEYTMPSEYSEDDWDDL